MIEKENKKSDFVFRMKNKCKKLIEVKTFFYYISKKIIAKHRKTKASSS